MCVCVYVCVCIQMDLEKSTWDQRFFKKTYKVHSENKFKMAKISILFNKY